MSSRFGWEGQYCTEVGERPADEKMASKSIRACAVYICASSGSRASLRISTLQLYSSFNHPFALTVVHIRKQFFIALQLLSIIVTANRR